MDKRIEVVERRVGDLKLDFGNPRKIKKQKREELEESLERYGDFGTIIINEQNQVIGGNQRVTIFQRQDPDMIVSCKLLIGYSLKEQKYINIKNVEERSIKEMEPIHYEKYDYVLIACRNELDYNDLVRKLGIEGGQVKVAKTRHIKGRAIWYDQMKAQILSAEEAEAREGEQNA